jgi:hypothetical protein
MQEKKAAAAAAAASAASSHYGGEEFSTDHNAVAAAMKGPGRFGSVTVEGGLMDIDPSGIE